MYKILIVDESEPFCRSLAELLPEEFESYLCHDGEKLAECLQTIRPDFLVLDLVMPGTDVLFVLEAANLVGIRPCILATMTYRSPYMERLLEQLQVSYPVLKPCKAYQLAARITDMALDCQLQCVPHKPVLSTQKVECFLRQLSFEPHLCGYKMTAMAICILIENPHLSMTKDLYPRVAEAWGTEWKQVEHAIRNSIQKAYKHRDEWIWKMFFPCGPDGKVEHLTNSLFLKCVANYLREEPMHLVASL